jgi:hypothetical protein
MELLVFSSLLIAMVSTASSYSSILSVSQSTWDTFNATISGRLHDGRPMFAPCFYVYNGTFQIPSRECLHLQRIKNNDHHISQHFGGYQYVCRPPEQPRPDPMSFRTEELINRRSTGPPVKQPAKVVR